MAYKRVYGDDDNDPSQAMEEEEVQEIQPLKKKIC